MNNSDSTNPRQSGLIIPATIVNSNGTYVQCVAIGIPTSIVVVSDETGYFQVQGIHNTIVMIYLEWLYSYYYIIII